MMCRWLRVAVRCLLLAGVLVLPEAPMTSHDQLIESSSVASAAREGRLRKLLLVRPVLIQYPLAYEIYC